ncbi:MAG: thioredoxin domain-containing protein [Candidatus Paceibacterota bacterium]
MKTNTQNGYGVPIAIIIAGVLIAGAVILTGNGSGTALNGNDSNSGHANTESQGEFRMPSDEDHIRGNPDAPIKIVEFSDFECPFCGRLHPTLARIVEENDDVAWVYRHFPLNSHTNAFSAAVASECVAQVGGNEAFWNFTDSAFANDRRLGNNFYESFVQTAGLDVKAFRTCLNDSEIAEAVQQDLDEVIAVGGRGTPFVVVVTPKEELVSFSGALPYEQIVGIIKNIRLQ